MRKKVLLCITKSNWGGAQRYVFDLATQLPQDKFDVVALMGGAGALKERLEAAGVKTLAISNLQRDVSFLKEFSAFSSLYTIFKNEKPDIVHLNSTKAGLLGAVAARMARVPKIIFTAHGWPFRERRNILMHIALWVASYLTALLSHTVICVSDYDLYQARFMLGVRAVRIYNGIDLTMTFGTGEKIRTVFPPGVRITGTIGELNKNKNQKALVEEAHRVPTMHVAIVGEGEDRAFLEELILKYDVGPRVKLFGFMPAFEVLRGFDIFVLPSLKEGLPYVLLEAKLAGLPIVANRVGGVGEILDSKDLTEFSLEKMVTSTSDLYLS